MIRFQRVGKKKHPTYRLIVSEKQRDTQFGSLELLGNYNPTVNPKVIDLKKERITYWLSKGAKASPSVHNLLVNQGVVTGKKEKSVFLSVKRKKKIEDKKAKETPAV